MPSDKYFITMSMKTLPTPMDLNQNMMSIMLSTYFIIQQVDARNLSLRPLQPLQEWQPLKNLEIIAYLQARSHLMMQ